MTSCPAWTVAAVSAQSAAVMRSWFNFIGWNVWVFPGKGRRPDGRRPQNRKDGLEFHVDVELDDVDRVVLGDGRGIGRPSAGQVLVEVPSHHARQLQDDGIRELVGEAELEAAGVQLAQREVRIVEVRIDRGDAGLAVVEVGRPVPRLLRLAELDAGQPGDAVAAFITAMRVGRGVAGAQLVDVVEAALAVDVVGEVPIDLGLQAADFERDVARRGEDAELSRFTRDRGERGRGGTRRVDGDGIPVGLGRATCRAGADGWLEYSSVRRKRKAIGRFC